jgi:hypothetical protein
MGTWKAQLGRITLFPTIPAGVNVLSALELYKSVWKFEPDSYQKQVQAGLPSIAQGTVGGFSVSCSTHPVRIDFSITPPPGPELNLVEDTKLFHEALAQIVRASIEGNTTAVNRVACFVQFACKAKDYREANELVRTILPKQYTIPLTDERDFVLQINSPRPLEFFEMNYITKWAVDRVQILSFQVLSPQQQMSPTTQLVSEHIVPSITFDNSNVPAAALTKEHQITILQEAFRFVAEQQRAARLDLEGF